MHLYVKIMAYVKNMAAWPGAGLALIVLMLPGLVRADVVGDAEDWFNKISTMQADFIQVASDGTTASGVIHLRRPHQMKIVYDLEEPLILLTTMLLLQAFDWFGPEPVAVGPGFSIMALLAFGLLTTMAFWVQSTRWHKNTVGLAVAG